MENSIEFTFRYLMQQWQEATLYDYGYIVLAIVVVGWAISRLSSK